MQAENIIQPNKVSHTIKTRDGAASGQQIVNTTDNLNTVPTFVGSQIVAMAVEAQQQLAMSTITQLDQYGGKQIVYISKDTNDEPTIVKFFTEAGFIKDVTTTDKTERIRLTSPANIVNGIAKAVFNPDHELADLRTTPWATVLKNKKFTNLFKEKDFDNCFEFICGPALAQRAVEIFKMSQQSKFLPDLVARYERQGEEGFVIRCLNTIPMGLIDKASGQLIAFCRLDNFENGIGHLGDTFVNEKVFLSRMLGTAYLYWRAMQSDELQLQKKFQWISLIDPPNRVDEFDHVYACRKPNQADDALIVLARFQDAVLCEESYKAKLVEHFYADKAKYPNPKPTRFDQLLFEQIKLLRQQYPAAAVSPVKQ